MHVQVSTYAHTYTGMSDVFEIVWSYVGYPSPAYHNMPGDEENINEHRSAISCKTDQKRLAPALFWPCGP